CSIIRSRTPPRAGSRDDRSGASPLAARRAMIKALVRYRGRSFTLTPPSTATIRSTFSGMATSPTGDAHAMDPRAAGHPLRAVESHVGNYGDGVERWPLRD